MRIRNNQETLRRVFSNDETLLKVTIDTTNILEGSFTATDADEYSQLGAAIGTNTHITKLTIDVNRLELDSLKKSDFLDGLKRNSSINRLEMVGIGSAGRLVLQAYEENNAHLTHLSIRCGELHNGGNTAIASTVRSCTNLREIRLNDMRDIDYKPDDQLLPIIESIRNHPSLKKFSLHENSSYIGCQMTATLLGDPNCNPQNLTFELTETVDSISNGGSIVKQLLPTFLGGANLQKLFLYENKIGDEGATYLVNGLRNNTKLQELELYGNSIGNIGCEAIATLLSNPNCNLQKLSLSQKDIGDQGAITLANGLTNNIKLQKLDLGDNPINNIDNAVVEAFSRVLCNTSSVSSTFLSNHTLKELDINLVIDPRSMRNLNVAWLQLEYLRKLNGSTNKSHIAIKKIFKCHPNIDMEQLFEFGTEDESLKALRYVVDWFEKARVAVADEEDSKEGCNIRQRKLSAIYQFARFMPLLFVPSPTDMLQIRIDAQKRHMDKLEREVNALKIDNGLFREQVEKLEKDIAMKDAKISSMTTKDKEMLGDEQLIANSKLERNMDEQRSFRWREILQRRMRLTWPRSKRS